MHRIDIRELEYATPQGEQGHIGYASAGGEVFRRCEDAMGNLSYWVSSRVPSDKGEYWQTAPSNTHWLRLGADVAANWPW